MKNYTKTKTAWFSSFYNIWPGNGASLFLQPWSPHGTLVYCWCEIFQRHKYKHTCCQTWRKSVKPQWTI